MKYLASLLISCLLVSPSFAQTEKRNAFDIRPTETVAEYNKQKISFITEDDIRHFLKVQTSLHKGPYQDYVDFITTRFSDDVVSTDKTTTVFENQQPTVNESKASKQDVLKEAKAVYDLMQGAQINNNIDQIVISADKKSATVKDTTSYFNSFSNDKTPATKTSIKINSNCMNKFSISQENILQLTESTCQTTVNVKQ